MAAHTGTASAVPAAHQAHPFDRMDDAPGFIDRLLECVWRRPTVVFWFFRISQWFAPFTRKYFVYRYDEVREAFLHDRELPVGWGSQMEKVTKSDDGRYSGRNFVLGMARSTPEAPTPYESDYQQLAEAFPLGHVPREFIVGSEAVTKEVIEEIRSANAGARIQFDAVEAIIHTIPTRLTGTYFGIPIKRDDELAYARWNLAASFFVFGFSKPNDIQTKIGEAGSANLRKAIDVAIEKADAEVAAGTKTPYSALRHIRERHLAEEAKQTGANREELAQKNRDQAMAQMFGMSLGFIPTNILAGGNMLETLLRYPEFMERTREAAKEGDDELVWRCIREALRFRNINPGMWRTSKGFRFSNGRLIPASADRVVISAQAAMVDSARIERPNVFDPNRRDEDYMIFGVGQHWCIGSYIAKAQLTQTFKQLVLLEDLKPISRWVRTGRYAGLYPMHLDVSFRS